MQCQNDSDGLNGSDNPSNPRRSFPSRLVTGRASHEGARGANYDAGFEIGKLRMAGSRAFEDVLEVFENAGIEFLDPVEGVSGEGVRFKWGVAPSAQQPGEGTAASEAGEGGLKAAWDFEDEEDADLDALLGEEPAPNPDMAEIWQADPRLGSGLPEGGRETLSRSMFGDCRAAAEGYFRGGHHAG